MTNISHILYNPDVLNCLANLSNDEVFTPPEIVNQMLDTLPNNLWGNPNAKFLDPVCKSGVFLREIAKRLNKGLEGKIPDLQQRINHIFSQQLYGLAITEMTALLSRRSVYCAKNAASALSVCTDFEDNQGNIYFQKIPHTWEGTTCKECGASRSVYEREEEELENHAYVFIHKGYAQKVLGLEKMKFDVIIGNPPYQLSDGGAQASAKPIYHLFVEQAKKLHPDYLVMITPSRWFAGGRGLEEFRSQMLMDRHIKELYDYPDSTDCFPGVSIEGGVSYFLWDKQYQGDCIVKTLEKGNVISEMKRPLKENNIETFIRYNDAIAILRKVQYFETKSFMDIVSAGKPFGLRTFFLGATEPYENDSILIYQNGGIGYVRRTEVITNANLIDAHKVYITYAYGMGNNEPYQVINKPFYGKPGSCCTETYLVIGPFENEMICNNVMSYMATCFFRFLVLLKKNTQHGTKKVYELVPQQDFSKPWTDRELYEKYALTEREIAFIEKMVRPMELDNV